MIAIEIRNDELRAIKFKRSLGAPKIIDKVSSVDIDFSEVLGLADGKILPIVDKITDLLYKLDIGDITKEKYTVAINLEGIMTQRVQIPKVKDSQIGFSARSALANSSMMIEDDKLVAFAIQKEEHVKEKTRGYNVLTQTIDRKVAASIVGIFTHMGLNAQYVDIAPNTIVKAFNKSTFIESTNPLTLVIDLSKAGLRFYRFVDNNFHFSYLENVRHNEKGYLQLLDDGIYDFINEFTDYSIEDMDILLMGEDEIIKEVIINYDGIKEMNRFDDGLELYSNPNEIKLGRYINSIGSSMRNDLMFSSQAKFDINLIRDIQAGVVNKSGKGVIKKIAILGIAGVVLGSSYLTFIKVTNMSLAKKNEATQIFLDDPETQGQIARKEQLSKELAIYENGLDTLLVIEDYLMENKSPYSARVYYSLTQSAPRSSQVNKLTYSGNNKIEIAYETTDENTFKVYLKSLEENPLIKTVEYGGYTSDADSYTGTIEVTLKGSVE